MCRTALSLFSGAGGFDLGIKNAGFSVLASVELDPHCCDTLRYNFSRNGCRTKVIEGDIRDLKARSLMRELTIEPGELDLLCGGPPCQSFSQIGKQEALEDERGLLLFEMIRFARAFRPKAILIEQVKGLLTAKDTHGSRGGVFNLLISQLEGLGYVPKWKILNAADYGVPQTRQRVFIVATRKPNGYVFPEPTHAAAERDLPLFSLKPYLTVGDVLKGLGRPSKRVRGKENREDSHVDPTTERDRERISYVPEGSHLAAQTHAPKDIVGKLGKKDTTKYMRLSRMKPSNTLRCGEIFFHPSIDRYITPRESMRIHGYPDDYFLRGPIRGRSGRVRDLDQHRQVANSVPPSVGEVLAQQVLSVLDAQNI